jgi:hypothetical protein
VKKIIGIFRYIILAVLILIAGCATPYKSKAPGEGNFEVKITDDTYVVPFKGNHYTSAETVWNYWIYRCAELTKEKGYKAFSYDLPAAITSENETTLKFAFYSPIQTAEKIQVKNKNQMPYDPYFSSPSLRPEYKSYKTTGRVQMFSPPYSQQNQPLIDAEKILDTLREFVKSSGRSGAPSRTELLKNTVIEPSQKIL